MPLTLSRTEILATKNPANLFKSKDDYKRLISLWHPDHADGDAEVFVHIKKLFNRFIPRFEPIAAIGGTNFTSDILLKSAFDLGEIVIGKGLISYVVDSQYLDLARNFNKNIGLLQSAVSKVKPEFEKFLPSTVLFAEDSNSGIIQIPKPQESLRLADVIKYFTVLPERHVAWIVSRLLNLCCYLTHIGMSHNNITIDTVFISPQDHTVHLLGEWFYAAPIGDKLLAAPQRTLEYGHIKDKIGNTKTDLELIKSLARELLGDISGARLYKTNTPPPMITWLRSPCSSNAIKEYAYWYNVVLTEAFGPKKFMELNVSSFDIY